MDSRWHALRPREDDPPDVVSAKLLQLGKLVKINEGRLSEIYGQQGTRTAISPVEQQPSDEAKGTSQQVIGTADSEESPFRIKRKDGQPKKGALGFKPLLRSSSKQPSSGKTAARAQSNFAKLPREQHKADNLPREQQLSPSAFRTPAVTRSLYHLDDGAQPSSDLPTEKAASTVLLHKAPEPAHNPRPWGRLELQQHDGKAAFSAQNLQQQPESGQRQPPSSPPLQEMSNTSSSWLAPEKRRGFQGKLRLKKNRSGTAALRRAAPAAASGQQGLQAPSQAALVSNESAHREAHTSRTEQAKNNRTEQDCDPCGEGITAVGSPKVMPAVEEAQDMVDITPEQPQWRSRQRSRLQQLAESAPARRQAGSGYLPLVQQPLTHPIAAGTSHQQPIPDDQPIQHQIFEQHAGNHGLTLEHLQWQQHQRAFEPSLQQQDPEQHAANLGLYLDHQQGQQHSKSTSGVANRRVQGESSSSESLQQLRAANFVAETSAHAYDAIPDTPECRNSKQSISMPSLVREALHRSSQPQLESHPDRKQSLLYLSDSLNLHDAECAPDNASIGAGYNGSVAHDVLDGSCKKDDSAALAGQSSRAVHGSKYYFGREVVCASASSSSRYIAVCLREQRSTGCSVQVWSMREEGCALGTLVLTAKGTLKSSNAGPAAMQQLLAVSSAGDRAVLASSAALKLEEGEAQSVSVLRASACSPKHEALSLPTQQETSCVFILPTNHLFAAGQGGHVHCWSLGNDTAHAAMSSKRLPAASFGGIAFPDIYLLESAGKDCILGCSSIGSVALWNYAKGELLIARQEAGFLLHGLQCLPSACLPQLAGQPRDKRPVAALALVQHRRSAFGAAQQQQQHLALTLMWPEQIAVSVLSDEEVVTHVAVAGAYAGLALASGVVKLIHLQKGVLHMEYGGMRGIRGLAAAGHNTLLVFFDEHFVLLDCFHRKQTG